MSELKQLFLVIMIIMILNVMAVFFSGASANSLSSESNPFTVSEVYGKALLGDYVYVKAEVSEVLEDHVSEKGYVYQEFIITDGEEEIKAFCSIKYGRTEIQQGDVIAFDGEFKKYYGEHEIYGFCSEVKLFKP